LLLLSIFISSHNYFTFIKDLTDNLISLVDSCSCPLEVLLYDDASNDVNKNFLVELDTTIFDVFHSSIHHKNPGHGRNYMLNKARGKYILFIDGDDNITCSIKQLCDELKMIKNEDMILSFPYFLHNGGVKTDSNVKFSETLYTCSDQEFASNAKHYAVHQTGIWNIYRRDFLIEHKLHFPTKLRSEDHLFTHYVLSKHPVIGRLNSRYYGWRLNENSYSNSKQVRSNNIVFLENALKILEDDLPRDIKNEIIFNLFNTTFSNLVRGYPSMSYKDRREYFTKLRAIFIDTEYTGDFNNTDIYFRMWFKLKFTNFLTAEILYQMYKVQRERYSET
jgi:CDP-glycerol glycerophosphotransferase